MPTYEVETDRGTYQLEIDQELDDSPQSHALLQKLVAHQLRYADASERNTAGSLATQVLGGVLDFGQQLLNTPAQIASTISEFVSPDAPGGPRRRVVPEVQAPQLPDVAPPETGLEKGVRIGSNIATGVATSLVSPAVRSGLRLRSSAPPGAPLMYEPGRLVGRSAMPGFPRVPTLAQPTGVLTGELSEGASNLARLFEMPRTMEGIRKMSQMQTLQARARLLSKVPDYDLAQEQGPLRELLEVLEQQILRYR
jgi:hypothetical protein